MTSLVSATPLRYHRLPLSDPRRRWWRPVAVGLLTLGLYAGVLLAAVAAVVVAGLTVPGVEPALDRFWVSGTDLGDPVTFVVLLASVALLLPALLVATRLVGSHPVGLVSSVAGRLRFRWLGSATLIAVAIWVPVMGAWVAVEALTGTLDVRPLGWTTTLALLVTTVALVPFQAAAEEYVFRGFLAQAVGSWLRHPVFAVLLPVPLFVAGHGYGALGAIDVAAFAVACGWLAWRTGGLEAPIAMHVVNNVVLMSLSAVGLGDPNATDTSWAGLGVSLVMMAAFSLLVTRRADALGIVRTRPVPAVAGIAESEVGASASAQPTCASMTS